MQALEHVKGRTLTGIVISDKNDKTIVEIGRAHV